MNDRVFEDNYVLSRGFSANIRINEQHHLWKDGLDYLLHPSIPLDSDNLRIADIGIGTGIWLIEMARKLPSSTQFDGFDVSFAQAPPAEWLPVNIHLHLHDCLLEPPDHMKGIYDIIHVQLFILLVPENDPAPVLRKLVKMLKPGGFISWGELDYESWNIRRTSAAPTDNNELTELLDYIATAGHTKLGPHFANNGWSDRLHQSYKDLGMSNVIVDRQPFAKEMLPFVNNVFLLASEEMSRSVLDPSGGGKGDIARKMISEVYKNRGSTAPGIDRLTIVGRKPEEEISQDADALGLE